MSGYVPYVDLLKSLIVQTSPSKVLSLVFKSREPSVESNVSTAVSFAEKATSDKSLSTNLIS